MSELCSRWDEPERRGGFELALDLSHCSRCLWAGLLLQVKVEKVELEWLNCGSGDCKYLTGIRSNFQPDWEFQLFTFDQMSQFNRMSQLDQIPQFDQMSRCGKSYHIDQKGFAFTKGYLPSWWQTYIWSVPAGCTSKPWRVAVWNLAAKKGRLHLHLELLVNTTLDFVHSPHHRWLWAIWSGVWRLWSSFIEAFQKSTASTSPSVSASKSWPW